MVGESTGQIGLVPAASPCAGGPSSPPERPAAPFPRRQEERRPRLPEPVPLPEFASKWAPRSTCTLTAPRRGHALYQALGKFPSSFSAARTCPDKPQVEAPSVSEQGEGSLGPERAPQVRVTRPLPPRWPDRVLPTHRKGPILFPSLITALPRTRCVTCVLVVGKDHRRGSNLEG